MLRTFTGVLLSLTAWLLVCRSAEAVPTPAILEPTINVAASTETEGAKGALVITVDGAKAVMSLRDGEVRDGELTLPKDLVEAAGKLPKVTFQENVLPLPASGTQRRWILPFTVFSMPAGMTLTRYVSFKIDGAEWALAYKLVSPAAVPTSWTVKPVSTSARSLLKNDQKSGLPIIVAVTGNQPIKDVQVATDPLEKDLKHPMSKGGWRLCKTPTGHACEPVTLPGAGMHKLWVLPAVENELQEGKYEVVLTVASADKPAGESVSLTVNVSSYAMQLAGLVALACGCILAIYTTSFLRTRLQRDEMLEPAVRLREAHDKLLQALDLADAGGAASNVRALLGKVNGDLQDGALEGVGLPKRFPALWTRPTDASRLDSFKRHVEAQAACLDAADALVSSGIMALFSAWKSDGGTIAKQPALTNAITKIDALAISPLPTPSALLPLIAREVGAFNTVLGGGAGGGGAAAGQPRTLQELRMSVFRTTIAAWAILLLVTVLVGTYSLILLNPGFGTCLDLVACFLWGMGLPTGAALAGATTATVATSLNVVRVQ
jgi:hypothetical protein